MGPAALVTTLVLALAGALVSGARAQDEPELADAAAPIDPAIGADIEAVLATVGLDAAWRSETGLHELTRSMTVRYVGDGQAAVEEMLGTVGQLRSTTDHHERVTVEVRRAAVELAAAREHQRDTTIERNRASAHLQGVVALTQSVAVDLFAGNGDSDDELLGVDGQDLVKVQRTMELQGHTLEEMLERRDLAIDRLDAAEVALADATAELYALTDIHTELAAEAADLLAVRRALEDRLRDAIPPAAEAFVLADVARVDGITPRAIDAYVRAELTMTELNPNCRISWRTIAAVGGVEGAHGTFGGRSLLMNGRPDDPIVGLRLDGIEVDNYGDTVANIGDTDGGRWDGDTEYDRAVGPMQFIPGTRELWGADGDGDGVAEPQDLDDAALAAAGYLCNYGRHSNWDNWIRAIFAYNHSPAYVNSVQARLMSMQRLVLPEIEGIDLWPSRPWGTFEPLPIPEPEPEEGEGVDGDAPAIDDVLATGDTPSADG
ncbi:MAG: hypothetical protein AAGA90_10915 [Actinomycetota bacterium]